MNQIQVAPVIQGFDYSTLDDSDVATDARAAARRINDRIRTTQDEIGRELIAIQARMPRGAFGAWMAAELGFTERTATNYMGKARFVEGKSETVSLLPPAALYALASRSADPDVVKQVLDDVEAGKKVTTAVVKERLAQAKTAQKKSKNKARKSPEEIKKELAAQEKSDLAHKKKWADFHAREDEAVERAARMLVIGLGAARTVDLFTLMAGIPFGRVERQFIRPASGPESKDEFLSAETIEKRFGHRGVA
jgi:hypothetical protein